MKKLQGLCLAIILLNNWSLAAMQEATKDKILQQFNNDFGKIKEINEQLRKIVLQKDTIKRNHSHLPRMNVDMQLNPLRQQEKQLRNERLTMYNSIRASLSYNDAALNEVRNDGRLAALKNAVRLE